MAKRCPKNLVPIIPSECIGNTREKLNENFNTLKNAACTMSDSLSSIQKRMIFLPPIGTVIRYWGDIEAGGINFDTSGRGRQVASFDQDLSPWALCNGNNETPDLRGRFIVGAGNLYDQDYPTGNRGPIFNSTTSLQFSSIQVSIPEMARHDHAIKDGINDAGHNHILTIIPHDHSYTDAYSTNTDRSAKPSAWVILFLPPPLIPIPLPISIWFPNKQTGARKSTTTITRKTVPHNSNLPSETSDDSANIEAVVEGGDVPHENRPPYCALGFIMRVA